MLGAPRAKSEAAATWGSRGEAIRVNGYHDDQRADQTGGSLGGLRRHLKPSGAIVTGDPDEHCGEHDDDQHKTPDHSIQVRLTQPVRATLRLMPM